MHVTPASLFSPEKLPLNDSKQAQTCTFNMVGILKETVNVKLKIVTL